MVARLHTVFWLATAWWGVYALMFAMNVVGMGEQQGVHVSWREAAAYAFGGWWTWIPFTMGLYVAVRRFPIERGQIARSAAALTAAVLAVVVVKAAYVYISDPIFNWYVKPPAFLTVLLDSLKANVMMAWAVVAVLHGLLFYQHARERDLKVAELKKNLAAARLEAIQAKLNPHFMFNALNSVSEMVHQDPEAAENMLIALSRLLRDSLSRSPKQERLLAEEVALVEDYLMIEKWRLGDRLQVEWRIEPRCLTAMTPVLALQPLVENAIVHAIARRREPSWLRITAHVEGQRLVLGVENSGARSEDATPGLGIGLESIAARLSILYGDEASLRIDRPDPDVFSVRVELPFSTRQTAVA